MGALAVPKLSVEEYLAVDRASEFKSEYHDGELFPIANVSWQHGLLAVNMGSCLRLALKGTPCRAAASPVRVRVSPTKFVYPDLLVVCGSPAFTDEQSDTITNPKVIVEILSPSTLDYDYGTKFVQYRELPSFEEYVLVSQAAYRIEVFRRAPDGRWVLSTYAGLDAVFPIEALNISVPLAEVYSAVL